MTMIDDKPTIAERYAVASETSDMRVPLDRRCPADILAAAAWSDEDGATLSRARNEFDKAKASIPENVGGVNRRMLTMLRVPGLVAAKATACRFAEIRNERFGLQLKPEQMAQLAWQALSAWMDPFCGHCTGRGFTGGYNGPQIRCRHCRETGFRRGFVGRTDAERNFVEAIICRIEDSVCEFNTRMNQGMR